MTAPRHRTARERQAHASAQTAITRAQAHPPEPEPDPWPTWPPTPTAWHRRCQDTRQQSREDHPMTDHQPTITNDLLDRITTAEQERDRLAAELAHARQRLAEIDGVRLAQAREIRRNGTLLVRLRDLADQAAQAWSNHDTVQPRCAQENLPRCVEENLDDDNWVTAENLLANTRHALADALNDDERAEAVSMLLDAWHDAWHDSAVTAPHDPFAAALVRLLRPTDGTPVPPPHAQGAASPPSGPLADETPTPHADGWVTVGPDPSNAQRRAAADAAGPDREPSGPLSSPLPADHPSPGASGCTALQAARQGWAAWTELRDRRNADLTLRGALWPADCSHWLDIPSGEPDDAVRWLIAELAAARAQLMEARSDLAAPATGGRSPAAPSQVQDIPDDQLHALVRGLRQGVDGWSSVQLDILREAARQAYRGGYAAALAQRFAADQDGWTP